MAGILKTFSLFQNRLLPNSCSAKMALLNIKHSIRTMKSETRDKLSLLNLPEKPKKPLTPYLQFVAENQVLIAKENPELSQKGIMKKCGQEWRATSEVEREKYIQKFKRETEIYNNEILRYNAKLTPEQLAVLKEVDSETRMARQKRKMNKLIKDMNKPKKPLSPYLLYMQEQRKIRDVEPTKFFESMKGEWPNLPESEKQKYQEMFLVEKAKYNKALLEWEKKMVAEGHIELVRSESLKSIQLEKEEGRKRVHKGNPEEKSSE